MQIAWQSNREGHDVFHLSLHGCLSGTLLHHGIIRQRYFKQKSNSKKGFNFLLIIRHEVQRELGDFSLPLRISTHSCEVFHTGQVR